MFMMPSIIGFYPAENRIYAVLLLIFRFNYMAVALQLPAPNPFHFCRLTHIRTYTLTHTCIKTNKIISKSAKNDVVPCNGRSPRARWLEEMSARERECVTPRAFISFHLIFMSIFVLLLHFVFRSMVLWCARLKNTDQNFGRFSHSFRTCTSWYVYGAVQV